MIEAEEVAKRGELLGMYANHFVERPWVWSRRGPEKVVYPRKGLWDRARTPGNLRYAAARGAEELWDRLRRKPLSQLDQMIGRVGVWPMFKARMRTSVSVPDGQLEAGGVIAYWEETGEYLQMVQPMVGAIVAEWMQAEPENEWAQKVAEKLEEIAARYAESLGTDDS